MKKNIAVILVFVLSTVLYAQDSGSLVFFAGYGQSAFADELNDDNSQFEESKYIPVGIQLLLGVDNLQVGAEVNYAVVPFTFAMSLNGTEFGEVQITQLYYGAVAKIRLGSGSGLIPYFRGGGGIYSGKFKVDYTDEFNSLGFEDSEMKFKSAFGFNFGVGVEINLSPNSGLVGELFYHKVKRQLDEEGAEEGKADNLALQVGFQFGF